MLRSHKVRWAIYIYNHENNVLLLVITTITQWVCGNSYTWAQDAHHVPKCMSFHKAIVVLNGRADCFNDFMYNELMNTSFHNVIYIYIYIYIHIHIPKSFSYCRNYLLVQIVVQS